MGLLSVLVNIALIFLGLYALGNCWVLMMSLHEDKSKWTYAVPLLMITIVIALNQVSDFVISILS